MMIPGLTDLIEQLPQSAAPFSQTQFPFPISQALFGADPDLGRLRQGAADLEGRDAAPQEASWIALAAGEAIESAQPDRDHWFISDGEFRGAVFGGIKWRAGWALIMGEGQEPYASAFHRASFMVYTTRPDAEVGKFLGDRQTSCIYFTQMLARYGLLYSDVQPGDLHELTHFVEDHGPGLLVVSGPLRPVESLLCLSLQRLGMRAAVTTEFPWEVGDRVEASSPDEAVEAVASFRNLRIRSQQDPLAALPDCANAAYAHEEFDTVRTLGGGSSFFLLRRGKSDGSIHVLDEPKSEIGVVVTIDDETLDAPAARELEGEAIGYLNMLRGVRVETAQPLTLALTGDAHPAEQLAEVVRRGLRLEYPRLGPIDVTITGNQREIARLAKEAGAEWQAREDALRAYADANVVYSCEACAPFSREHVCFAHPLRNPMCGRRWAEMLVGARYMGLSSGRPWRRRGRPENCCAVVDLGRAIDPLKGEYEALNAFVRQATNDRMQRVFLHSVREFPHSSCGCFAALAWWSDGLGGIAIMHRGFDGVAPDGSTWNLLANRAGGKQQPGITGVGLEYMRSPLFLQGDGGWKNVKWMTRKLQEELEGSIPAVTQIPTEAE